jgi:hypothetical protein
MKTKPVVITLAIIAVLICGFLFVRSKYLTPPHKAEVVTFLNQFNTTIKAGDVKPAKAYFDESMSKVIVNTLVNVLSNKTAMGSKAKPLFKVALNTDDSKISFINSEVATANIEATFHRDSIPDVVSTITFTIHKVGAGSYKIYKVDPALFNKDYTAFQNTVINRTVPEKDLFSPQTLAAFKTANGLKARYDSVLWFQYVDNKPWFYVVKGKLPEDFYWGNNAKDSEPIKYKMALLNPDLKEVIPAEYDLIHNVGGTIAGLIEVQKGNKVGFYDVAGKLVVPVNYDQALPLNDGENKALLKNGNDYSYLKNDLTIGEVLTDFKLADALPMVKYYAGSYKFSDKNTTDIMEYNDRTNFSSLIIPPGYLVEWKLLPKFLDLPNKLRTAVDELSVDGGEGSRYIDVKFDGEQKDESNWFSSAFYSIVNDYIGGRGGLYETKTLLVVDKKQNRVLGFDADTYFGEGEGGGTLSSGCNENSLKAINDSLFEFKTTSNLNLALFDENDFLQEGPYYHYLQIKDGKLVALESKRIFPTEHVKLDDSYLQGCYALVDYTYKGDETEFKKVDHLTNAMLQYMKNEIYASYLYKFKSPRWNEIFKYRFNIEENKQNVTVDDSLTAIDKYNINWINSKLNPQKPAVLAAQ